MTNGLLTSYRGVAFCHAPVDEPVRVDKLVSTDGDDDRWNGPGQPTLYLALDPAVALAELARHLDVEAADDPVRRRVLAFDLDLDGLLDLREAGVRRAIAGPDDVAAFRDRGVARGVAARAREQPGCRGLLVPSMAFLDHEARANLVLFVERLDGDVADVLARQRDAGSLEIRPAADPPS